MIKKCGHCLSARQAVETFLEKASEIYGDCIADIIRGEVKVVCYHCNDGWQLTENGDILAGLIAAKLGIKPPE